MFGRTAAPIVLAAAVQFVAMARAGASHRAGAQPDRAECRLGSSSTITIAATTDTHGRIRGWDYYGNRAELNRGLTRAATIVDSLRAANPGGLVLVDAGDLLQGNPFAYVAARITRAGRNPIIAAMNAMRYDAAAIGNHEFNYGVPYLNRAISQARFPFLAANVYHVADRREAYLPATIVVRRGIRIAIVGATTPGSDLWDAQNLHDAGIRVDSILPAVRSAVMRARRKGTDIVVVVMHSGLNEPSTYDTVSTGVPSENVAARVATEIPGIDVVVYGHTHKENAGQLLGRTLVIQPKNWATSVASVSIPVTCSGTGGWTPGTATGAVIQGLDHAEARAVLAASDRVHGETVRYVTSPIGSTPVAWLADSARVKDVPLTDFILEVERRAAHADIASTAAFDLRARLGPGPITIAQLAQLYPYENTLRAIRVSGSQLRAYLDYSSRYYRTEPDGSLVVDTTVAGYNFDIVSGVDYTLDTSQPLGHRVTTLTFHGRPVAPTDSFTFALNNYRQTGGGGYSMLRNARVVYDRQQEIRELLIDEVRRKRVIRPSDYFVQNWSFVRHAASTPR